MGKVRRCDAKCHIAKGPRCTCWCGGAFHGAAGAANREWLAAAGWDEVTQKKILGEHGFIPGKTKYLEQSKMNLEVEKNGNP